MAGVLIDLFRDYRISGNIRYFIANNTELNDTYINAILRALYLNILAKLRKGYRLCYFSYITNLYAQAFIIRNNIEGTYKELATIYYKIDFKKVKELQRKREAVGLLYNLMRYIYIILQYYSFFQGIKIGGPLAEFNRLEVSNKILYRALVLRSNSLALDFIFTSRKLIKSYQC